MFLSKLAFQPTFREPRDLNSEHKLIMMVFPSGVTETPREEFAVLYRKEATAELAPYYLIQSNIVPDLNNIKNPSIRNIANLQVKDSYPSYQRILDKENPNCSIKIRINPVKTREGKRQPVSGQENIYNWLKERESTMGIEFKLPTTEIIIEPSLKLNTHKIATASVIAKPQVIDKNKLWESLNFGIGKEKAYGYGLLLLAN